MVNYWLNEPDILIDKDYIFNLIPSGYKKRNENFNAITRLIIVIIFLMLSCSPQRMYKLSFNGAYVFSHFKWIFYLFKRK